MKATKTRSNAMLFANSQKLSQTKGGIAVKATDVKANVVIVANCYELAQEALGLFVRDARKAIKAKGRFCAAISRHTPSRFFRLLGEQGESKEQAWDKIHLFWVDECCGPRDFRDTNHNIGACSFIGKAGIPAENVHQISCENRNCGYVASRYEQTIHNVVGLEKDGMPRFDLIILGMDADGHIASLYPDTYAFFDTQETVCVIYFMDGRYTRITLSNPVLCAASHIAVLVRGEEKARILREVLTAKRDEVRYPIHSIWPILDKVTWLVDRNAGKYLLRGCRSNKTVRGSLESIEPYRRL